MRSHDSVLSLKRTPASPLKGSTAPGAKTPHMPTVIFKPPSGWFLVTPNQSLLGLEHNRPKAHSALDRGELQVTGLYPLLPTCLMCRRDLKMDSFRDCQFPQSASKEESVGHLASSCPSAPSGETGAFSSSSALELSQLSDSSSRSTRGTTKTVMKHAAPLDSFNPWAQESLGDHFSPGYLVVKPTSQLLTSGLGLAWEGCSSSCLLDLKHHSTVKLTLHGQELFTVHGEPKPTSVTADAYPTHPRWALL